MAREELLKWITSGIKKGVPASDLRKSLRDAGYSDEKMEAAFEKTGVSEARVQKGRHLLPAITIGLIIVALVAAVVLKFDLFKGGGHLSEEEFEAILQKGLDLYDIGDYASAEETFRRMIEADPANATGYNFLGWTLLEQGKTTQAEAMFIKAAELDSSPEYIFILGYLYMQQEMLTKAEQALLTANSLDPSNPNVYFALARVYQSQGDTEKARESFEEGSVLSTEEQTHFILEQMPELKLLRS